MCEDNEVINLCCAETFMIVCPLKFSVLCRGIPQQLVYYYLLL